jgi:putative tryptophan/tyrosine transport system substrate-binding protein
VRRRELIVGIASAPALPFAARAQQDGRVYRIGFLVLPPKQVFTAFFDEMRRHGFVDGKNLIVDPRGFSTPVDRLGSVAAEIVRARPDAIYAGGDAAARAVEQATQAIPIVVTTDDALRAHLVTSLAHPGGNLTGISIFATELDGKRLQLLAEAVPDSRRIAALVDPNTTAPDQIRALIEMARSRGVALSIWRAAAAAEIAPAIAAARAAGAQALDVLSSALFNANRASIFAHVAEARLPAMYQWPDYVHEGALIGYGPLQTSFYRQAARLLVAVLRGAKPADLPVEQPTKIELAINLKTARALGLAVPPILLAQADEVIQ